MQLLFEGGVYFVGKPADSNASWNRLHAGYTARSDSTHSLSVLLSAMETSLRTQTTLKIAQWASTRIISTCVHTNHGYYSRAAFILFGAFWSRATSNQRNRVASSLWTTTYIALFTRLHSAKRVCYLTLQHRDDIMCWGSLAWPDPTRR